MSAPFTLSCWVRTAAQMQAQFGAVAPTAAQVGRGGVRDTAAEMQFGAVAPTAAQVGGRGQGHCCTDTARGRPRLGHVAVAALSPLPWALLATSVYARLSHQALLSAHTYCFWSVPRVRRLSILLRPPPTQNSALILQPPQHPRHRALCPPCLPASGCLRHRIVRLVLVLNLPILTRRWSPMAPCWAMQARCHWPETTYMARWEHTCVGRQVQPGGGTIPYY